jgi:hypothetical protein
MATTTNYGWTTPDDTDLLKDGAAAIRTLGSAIDTTVFNNAAAAVAKSTVDAKGDLLVGTADDTVGRLAVGTDGYTLVADSAETTGLKWAAPSGGGKVLQVVQDTTTTQESTTSTSYVDTNLSQAITPSANTSKILVIASLNAYASCQAGGSATSSFNIVRTSTQLAQQITSISNGSAVSAVANTITLVYLDSPATTSSTTYKVQMKTSSPDTAILSLSSYDSTLTLIEIGA